MPPLLFFVYDVTRKGNLNISVENNKKYYSNSTSSLLCHLLFQITLLSLPIPFHMYVKIKKNEVNLNYLTVFGKELWGAYLYIYIYIYKIFRNYKKMPKSKDMMSGVNDEFIN